MSSRLASANIIESLLYSYNCEAKIMTERHKREQAYCFYLGGIEDKDIHTEGWKTNKSWKVGPKIILPYGCCYEKDWGFNMYSGYVVTSARDFYNDIDRACCFLSGKKLEDITTVDAALANRIKDHRHTANIGSFDSTFFTITMFKKGTVHLVWKDRELLNTFNQTAAKHKKWIGVGF